ncbi:hypothetical protein ACOALZ_00630 [Nocardiopsis algeriensis]
MGDLYEPPFTSLSPGGPEHLFTDEEIDTIETVLDSIRATAVPQGQAAG